MPKGFTLWFTGLSGSGKSTLANAVALELQKQGRLIDLLDGDVVRQHLSKGLGFSKEDRDTNIRRIGFVAHLITRHGGVAITAAISPYRAIRDENRKLIGDFVEVYAKCPIEECEKRDVKGLYKKAREAVAAGKGMQFTGVDDPYEEPSKAEIVVDTSTCTVQDGVKIILEALNKLGYLEAGASAGDDHRAHHEYVPDELLKKAEAAFKSAGKVHTDVLLKELHIGFSTAAHVIDKLAEQGKVSFKG